jgi:hypothetical protein
MIGRMGADRERQAVAIDDRHDFHAFSASRRPNLLAAALRRCERCIDVALGFVNRTLVAKSIRQVRECRADHFVPTPLLEAAMQRLIVRVVLREHVPPCTRIQDPQRHVENVARRNRLAARAIVRNVLLRKMLPDPTVRRSRIAPQPFYP